MPGECARWPKLDLTGDAAAAVVIHLLSGTDLGDSQRRNEYPVPPAASTVEVSFKSENEVAELPVEPE